MSDLRDDMTKSIEASIKQLSHVRDVRHIDAAVAIASTYADNLEDSRGTSMESYWQAMVEIVNRIVAVGTGAWSP